MSTRVGISIQKQQNAFPSANYEVLGILLRARTTDPAQEASRLFRCLDEIYSPRSP